MSVRRLFAYIDGQLIGTLSENNGLWGFQYAPSWLDNRSSFGLSPWLPLQQAEVQDEGTNRPVQWYFDNLLPEESVRELLARDAGLPDVRDAFALLEYYGRESAGSVSLLTQHPAIALASAERPLSDDELEQRIQNLPRIGLTHAAPKKMSLAGAQHKLAVIWRDGQLLEPVGATPSTHILKPDHPNPDHYAHSVINEWFIMRVANAVGLPVPHVDRHYVPSAVYLIKRFDRAGPDGAPSRLHAIDGCQLLNLAPTMKYRAWSIESLNAMIVKCRAPVPARLRVFRWLVFCIVVGNGDSHLKNLSYLVDDGGISLSPHYDLLCEAVYETQAFSLAPRWPDQSRFTAPLLDTVRYTDFTRATLVDAGIALGLNEATARRQIDDLLLRIPEKADQMLKIIEAENRHLLADHPHLAATFAGENRLLRAIRHSVIAEMTARLQR
jgi:serine/threonine-protein kinase HipA